MSMAFLLSPMVAAGLGCIGCKTIWDYLEAIAFGIVIASALVFLFFWWPNRRRNRASLGRRRRKGGADPPPDR